MPWRPVWRWLPPVAMVTRSPKSVGIRVARRPLHRVGHARAGQARGSHGHRHRTLASKLTVAPREAPVWAHTAGSAEGPALSSIYRTAPQVALTDPALHRLLALLDALRTGRARERALAVQLMQAELMKFDSGVASAH